MNILLVSATVKEIQPFIELYRTTNKYTDIDILISGIGLTAATYHISKQLNLKRPGIVIQAGVAGCFDRKIPLGTVLAVKKDTIADQGVIEEEKLRTLFDLGLVRPDEHPFKNGWLENKTGLLDSIALRKVIAISVNEITTAQQRIKFYHTAFRPSIESMEGAAFHYTCLMEGVPFVQLRSVSNYIAERDKKKWDMKTAIFNLNKELIKLVESV